MLYDARVPYGRSGLLLARIDIETTANGAPEAKIKVKRIFDFLNSKSTPRFKQIDKQSCQTKKNGS